MSTTNPLLTLEQAICWPRSGHEFDKVYRYLFLHPEDLFTIPPNRSWSIGHQIVYHGNVNLLQRVLALYREDQIDIHTLSKDGKTLLDVAVVQKSKFKTMYDYVEHLYLQDDLIRAAKQQDWRLINDILDKHPKLANEKPPYSTYFLLHYVIQNGTKDLLENLIDAYKFEMNVLSSNQETLIDMAKRLGKDDMCSIIESLSRERGLLSSRDEYSRRSDLRNTSMPTKFSSVPSPIKASSTSTPPSSLPYPLTDPFAGTGIVTLTLSGDFEVISASNMHLSGSNLLTTVKPTDDSLPEKPVMRNLTCPLTNNVFKDPVVASDGQTYERAAITKYVQLHHCSPITGVPMNAVFRENTEIKQMIQSLKKKE